MHWIRQEINKKNKTNIALDNTVKSMLMFTRKEIIVSGYTFTVESSLGDDGFFRLLYKDIPVIDDSACTDYYGNIDTVADIMAENIKEEAEKPFPWFTLENTIVEQGGEPVRIQWNKEAEEWGRIINDGCPVELTDENEIKAAKERLGFDEDDEVVHVYAFDGGEGHFILEKDY